MPTKRVGCILVTSHLQQFLEDYEYKYDKEYVTLLKYTIHLNIDLSTFLTFWAVLSILLDTQNGKCEYVKLLQEKYNTYYADKSRKYMLKLVKK